MTSLLDGGGPLRFGESVAVEIGLFGGPLRFSCLGGPDGPETDLGGPEGPAADFGGAPPGPCEILWAVSASAANFSLQFSLVLESR